MFILCCLSVISLCSIDFSLCKTLCICLHTDLHSEQHKLLDALVLLKSATMAVNSKAVMGVFMQEWAALQGLTAQPTILRVQTKATPKDAPMADPLLPSALLTARHAPRNASTQGLYEFLPADALIGGDLKAETAAVGGNNQSTAGAFAGQGERSGAAAHSQVSAAAGPEAQAAEDGSLLSRLLNRSWWRGRGGWQQHRSRAESPRGAAQAPAAIQKEVHLFRYSFKLCGCVCGVVLCITQGAVEAADAVDGHPALRANWARHHAATQAMLNTTMHKGTVPVKHDGGASEDVAEQAQEVLEDVEGKAFWEEDEEPAQRQPVTATRTVGMEDEDEDRAAGRTVAVHMREAYDDGDDDDGPGSRRQ